MSYTFSAKIGKVGINPCVDVPKDISDAFGIRGNITVKGFVNHFPFRSTLVPIGDGYHRLYINTEMRRGAAVDVGSTVSISIEFDSAPREYPIPKALLDALRENDLREEFESLTRARRRDILAYLNSLKRPDSMRKNVEKVIAELRSIRVETD